MARLGGAGPGCGHGLAGFDRTNSERPVIAGGCGTPSSSSIVGATSQMRPRGTRARFGVVVVDVHQRHRERGVRGVRLSAGRIFHQLAVAVVGSDEHAAALRARRGDDRRRLRCRPLATASRPRRPASRCAPPCRGWRSSPARSRTCRCRWPSPPPRRPPARSSPASRRRSPPSCPTGSSPALRR